jgi:hypothetical protein
VKVAGAIAAMALARVDGAAILNVAAATRQRRS